MKVGGIRDPLSHCEVPSPGWIHCGESQLKGIQLQCLAVIWCHVLSPPGEFTVGKNRCSIELTSLLTNVQWEECDVSCFWVLWWNTSIRHLVLYEKVPSVHWCCLVGRQEEHPACKKLTGGRAGMVICLKQGADLCMAQLVPLPLTVSCFSKIQIGFTFLVPAHLGSPRKGPLNGCVCVCAWWTGAPIWTTCLGLPCDTGRPVNWTCVLWIAPVVPSRYNYTTSTPV